MSDVIDSCLNQIYRNGKTLTALSSIHCHSLVFPQDKLLKKSYQSKWMKELT